MLKRLLSILLILLCYFEIMAQQDFTLYHMRFIPQFSYTNPASMPKSKFHIGLPAISSIYLSAGNSGFKYNDVIQKRADDSLVINMDNLISKLKQKNYFTTSAHIDLLSFGFKVNKNYFSFNVTEKINSRFIYPKALIQLVWEGNGRNLLGERANMDGLGYDFMHYREYGLGYAREINEKLTVGIKAKYLYGMENIWTKKSVLGLTTDSVTFELTADGSMEINTSGVNQLTDPDYSFEPTSYAFKLKNHGAGIDLGAKYKINEKFGVSASIIDLGFIEWKDDVKNFKQEEFEFTFRGVNLNELIAQGDTTGENTMTALTDSLKKVFVLQESYNRYTTSLTSRAYLGGTYAINKQNFAGILVHGEIVKKQIRPSLSLSYNTQIKDWLSASVSYSIYNRSYNNLGAGLSVNIWPLQIYVVSDNILAPMLPHTAKNAHIHFGINLTFGRKIKDKDGDKIVDKKDDCPNEAGLVQFKGCPDKDGDNIMDKADDCPDIFGLAQYKGCPDRDSDGIIDKMDNCPDEAGIAQFSGCPDRDKDGITDKEDDCPDEAGLTEFKGCPDRDSDGVKDSEDKCPDKSGPVSNQGCPETKLHLVNPDGTIIKSAVKTKEGNLFIFDNLPPDENVLFKLEGEDVAAVNEVKVVVSGITRPAMRANDGYFKFEILKPDDNQLKKIEAPDVIIKLEKEEEEILKKAFNNLEFASGKDIIKETSYSSLEELAGLLNKKKTWRIKISGHTDNVGKPNSNMILSQKRAEAVKNLLIGRGVPEDRIIVRWYGQTMPIADNKTPLGRQMNRRVEMLIIE